MRTLEVLVALIAISVGPAAASGQAPPPDLAAENRALVQRLVLDRAAAVASVQRIADEREEQLFAELTAKDRRLRAEQRTRKEAQAELAEVTAERQRLVDEIAARNRRFAAEIEEYRRQVASIANSPDPRKREALKRYVEGHRAEAYDDLVEIQEAETKAVAAGWREIAALAQDRKDRGEIGTAEAIRPYEKAQAMDADYAWGWIELRRLYQEVGRLPDARRAAEQALMRAQSDRDRSAAETELGEVLAALGDLMGARARCENSLTMDERLAASSPSSADAQRNLSVSLERLGDVLVVSGDLSGALARFKESLKILERLAASNPSSAAAQRDLSVSLIKLGEVLLASEDLSGARARFEESLKITERLAASNPSSTAAQRDLGVSLERLGEVLLASEDLAGARARFEESLKIRERLAASSPSSADAQRDLIVSHVKLGGLPEGESHWSEALRIALELQSQGRLAPQDAWMVDELRKRVADVEKANP
jgi:tetratricopeptide (TPR) repeat protein